MVSNDRDFISESNFTDIWSLVIKLKNNRKHQKKCKYLLSLYLM